jgi:hypothetical protein
MRCVEHVQRRVGDERSVFDMSRCDFFGTPVGRPKKFTLIMPVVFFEGHRVALKIFGTPDGSPNILSGPGGST